MTMRRNPGPFIFIVALAAVVVGALAGCATGGSGAGSVASPAAAVTITGKVYGGQNPVAGASIQLYTVGTGGLKSASTGLITAPLPTSDQNGSYSITGRYNACNGTTPGTLVYLVATGGVAVAGETNNNLVLMAALGPCSALSASTTIIVNEVTTVAAAYALAPFAADYAHIGAQGTNPTGLVQAFQNAALLANTATGGTGGAGLAAGVSVPVAELNTLGDILAACINTGGTAAADGGNCTTLFNASGAAGYSATATPDVFGAALGIAKNPGASAVTGLFTLFTPAGAPFAPILQGAPNDFTVAATFTGPAGTLATPYAVSVDGNGNAWVANAGGKNITQITPAGAATNFTASGLFGPKGIAVDTSNNVWVSNTAGNAVLEFTAASSYATATVFSGANFSGPSGIALDLHGNAWVTNFNGNSVTEILSTGTVNTPYTGNGNISTPSGVALDGTGNVYVTSGSGVVVYLDHNGGYVMTLTDNALQGPVGVAVDEHYDIVATGYTTGSAVAASLGEFFNGAAGAASPVTTSFASTAGVAGDGTSFWVANNAANGGLAQYVYGSATPVSPAAGFGSLNAPVGVAVDATGSVWTANAGSNTVSKFIGLAVPVVTPLASRTGPR